MSNETLGYLVFGNALLPVLGAVLLTLWARRRRRRAARATANVTCGSCRWGRLHDGFMTREGVELGRPEKVFVPPQRRCHRESPGPNGWPAVEDGDACRHAEQGSA
jgi:hypothetical protein